MPDTVTDPRQDRVLITISDVPFVSSYDKGVDKTACNDYCKR